MLAINPKVFFLLPFNYHPLTISTVTMQVFVYYDDVVDVCLVDDLCVCLLL